MKWWPWSNPKPDVSIGQADFVVFDLETSGLDPSRDDILSFGAVRMHGARIDLGSAYGTLVRPVGHAPSAENSPSESQRR